jgi:hypothetical protein
MKVTIEFDGNEEREDLQDALDGYKWKLLAWNLDQEFRKVTKYGFIETVEANNEQIKNAEYWRSKLGDLLDEYNLNLD